MYRSCLYVLLNICVGNSILIQVGIFLCGHIRYLGSVELDYSLLAGDTLGPY